MNTYDMTVSKKTLSKNLILMQNARNSIISRHKITLERLTINEIEVSISFWVVIIPEIQQLLQ